MNGVLLKKYGDSLDNLEYRNDIGVPKPQKSQVLIKVHASSINPLDNVMRKGYAQSIVELKLELPFILGRDCSGEVVEVGSDVWDFKVGDMVWGASAPFSNGTHSEYVLMDETEIARKPKNLSHLESASIPFAGLTAWNAIFNLGNLNKSNAKGKKVLVNGANGGVGFFSVNVLKKYLDCFVVATCHERNFDKLKNLGGADQVIDYRSDSGYKQYEREFDLVLNCVDGGSEVERKCINVLKSDGHFIGFNGPLVKLSDKEGLILGLPKGLLENQQKQQSIRQELHSSNIKFDSCLFTPSGKSLKEITKLVESNKIELNIGKIFPLSDIDQAFQCFEEGNANGKIIIENSK
eukprot:gene2812-3497_t